MFLISGLLLITVMGANSHAAAPRDCDNNSIISCGALTADELAQRYTENKTGDLPAVYQNYGISGAEMTHAGTMAKMGVVHKDGRVMVGNDTVATNASSIGRQNIFSGSTIKKIGGKTYYDTPPSRSFKSESITVYVFFDQNGQFKAAVLSSCGNPVSAVPTPKPKPPVPPQPPKQPQAQYTCDSLTVTPIDRTSVSFDTKTSVTNATLKSIEYIIRDENGNEVDRTTDTRYTQTKSGNYSVQAIVTVTVNGQDKIAPGSCQRMFQITAPQECKPGIPVNDSRCNEQPPQECKPGVPMGDKACNPCTVPGKENLAQTDNECQAAPAELPHTGPMDMIGGGIGLGSLLAAGYYLYMSRRDLLAALLSR